MIESLEQRKTQLQEHLRERYKPVKPRNGWHRKQPEYKTTAEFGNPPTRDRWVDKLVIKNNFIEAVIFTAFLLLFTVVSIIKKGDTIAILFMLGFLGFSLYSTLDRRPKLIMDDEAIWAHRWPSCIEWQYIVASYIKINDDGETKTYSLIIHYYDPRSDFFEETNCRLDGLDIS